MIHTVSHVGIAADWVHGGVTVGGALVAGLHWCTGACVRSAHVVTAGRQSTGCLLQETLALCARCL